MVGFAFHTHHVTIADRAAFRHRELLVATWMLLVINDFHDLGDYIAAAFYHDPVTDLHVEALDFIHVVQRRAADRGPADGHSLEPRYGSEFARTSDLHADVFHSGDAAARRILVRDGPARRFPRESQPVLQPHGIYLDYDAVNFVRQFVTHGLALGDELEDFVKIARQRAMLVHLEACVLQGLQRVGMMFGKILAGDQEKVRKQVQTPLRHDVRLQDANGSSGGIARIGKLGQTLCLAVFIHAFESLERHDDLAADLEILRNARFFERRRRHRERDGAHGADVRGYVLAHRAIAARHAARQFAFLIGQRQGHAVQLELADILDLVAAGQLVDAPVPVAEFFFTEGVVERKHGPRVLDLHKTLARLAAHALRRRIRSDQLGVRGFQALQFLHEQV